MPAKQHQRLHDNLFSVAAVELKLLTPAQLTECLVLQEHDLERRPLTHVCIERGLLNPHQVADIRRYQSQLLRRGRLEASLFGHVAVSMGALTRDQVAQAVRAQSESGYAMRLGQACVELGFVDDAGVQAILRRQKQLRQRIAAEVPAFGEIALDLGLLTREQLDECIHAQRAEGFLRRIGEVCVEKGYLDSGQVTEVLEVQSSLQAEAADSERPSDERAQAEPTADPLAERSVASPHPPTPVLGPGADTSIDGLLRHMVEQGCSDLHLSSGHRPTVRIDGKMTALVDRVFDDAALREHLLHLIPQTALDQFKARQDADFAYAIQGVARFRANYFVDRNGIGAVFRQIPYEILPPEKLGLPAKVVDLCWLSKGLVLVTGPTGSGKSTTLAALVDYINRNRDEHIITIEDPIEFVHESKRCLVNQREVGEHTQSFKAALRAALREDPDIVLVGELRDLETVAIALETAETGHLVFGTLHTNTASSTIDRVIDQFPAGQQAQVRTMLSETLRGVIAQMLCQKIGGGRVAAFEILMANAAVANLIREGKTEQLVSVMQTGSQQGMHTMNTHLVELVKTGQVEPLEAYLKAHDKHGLVQAFEKLGIVLPANAIGQFTQRASNA